MMESIKLKRMSQEEFKKFIEAAPEDSYVLIDVREPEEYEEEHLPGATLIPLKEIETGIMELDLNKDFIFYCLSGKRSEIAANLIADLQIVSGKIYYLKGGILYWEGRVLDEYPRINVFDFSKDIISILKKAMDLEKGAERFYRRCSSILKDTTVTKIMSSLARFEVSHARFIFSLIKKFQKDLPAFETLYDSLDGNILEGGMSLEDAIEKVSNLSDNLCLSINEMALEIEFRAYDLYRNLAIREKDPEIIRVMYMLAEQEKLHVKLIANMLSKCVA